MTNVKAVVTKGVPEKKLLLRQSSRNALEMSSGIDNDKILEAHPTYAKANSEKIIEGQNNNFIILGRDRPTTIQSGYGGKGDTHAGRIDIIAGLSGRAAREVKKQGDMEEFVTTNPSAFLDASRIYMSQKTDIDENFKIVKGKVGNPTARAGIAIKSDGIRIIGREGIKLVTGTDRMNAQGVVIDTVSGIDLIAGNDDKEIQPIPKGTNLVDALNGMLDLIADLSNIVTDLTLNQTKLITNLMTHIHISAVGPTSPSPDFIAMGSMRLFDDMQMVSKLTATQVNLATHKAKYHSPAGKGYINSRHNNTN